MALGAYELLVIVRAQNMASGQLRSVSRDLRAMGASGAGAANNLRAINNQRWDKVSKAGSITRDAGRSMRLFGLATAAGLGLAAKAAADFNTEVTLAATQTGHAFRRAEGSAFASSQDIARNTATLSKGILAQMKLFPATSHEMAGAAYEIFSSFDTSLGGGVKLLKVFNKAAVAGQTDLQDVTKAGITVLNDFDANTRNAAASMTEKFQRMFAAVRFGRMTFGEFAQSLNTTVPAAKAADQSFDTLSGTMAFLTRRMPNVRMAGTSLARLMELLGRKKMVEGLKAVNVQITDTHGRMKQLPQIMDILLKKFPELAKGGPLLRNFFKQFSGTEGTIMARRAFVFLAKDMDFYRQMLRLVRTDNTEFSRSFDALSKTSGVKWKVFLNRLHADLIEFGQAVLPAIEGLAAPVERLIGWFEKLDDSTKRTIGRWAVYASVIGIFGGTLLALAGGLMNLIGIFGRFGLLGAGFVGLFVRLAAVLVGAQLAMGHFGHNVNIVEDALNGLKRVLSSFFDFATSGWQGFALSLGGIGLLVKRMATTRAGMLRMAGREATTGGILSTMLWGVGGRPGFRREVAAAETEVSKVARMGLAERAAGSGIILPAGAGRAVARDVEKAAVSGGRLSRALALAGGAALSLPGPLKLAAAAVGIGAIAAGIWWLHTRKAREEAERIKASIATIGTMGTAAQGFSTFGLDARNMDRARLNVHMIKLEIADLQRQIAKAPAGSNKLMMVDQLKGLKLDLADAMGVVDEAQAHIQKSVSSVGAFIVGAVRGSREYSQQQERVNKLQKEYNFLISPVARTRAGNFEGSVQNIKRVGAELEKQKGILATFGAYARSQANEFGKALNKVLTDIGRTDSRLKLRPRIDLNVANMKRDLQHAILSLGRVTPGQLKLLIAAELDPRLVATLPAKLRAALRGAQKQRVIIDADVRIKKQATIAAGRNQSQIQRMMGLAPIVNIEARLKSAGLAQQGQTAHGVISKKFPTILQHVKVQIPPAGALSALGADISSGIASGLHDIDVTITKHFENIVTTYRKVGKMQSPSRVMASEVGKPIVQGIAQGILQNAGLLDKATIITFDDMFAKMRQVSDTQITLFAGQYMQKIEESIKPLTKIQEGRLADLQAKLAAGKKMSQAQLASMHQLESRQTGKLRGIDLTRDTQGQLTQLRLFNQGIQQLVNRGAPVELLNQLRDLGVDGTKYITQLANMSGPALKRFIGTFQQLQAETKKANSLSLSDYVNGIKASNDEIAKWEAGIRKLKAAHANTQVIDYFINKGLAGYQELATFLAARGTPEFKKYVQQILRGNQLVRASNFQTAAAIKQASADAWKQAADIAHQKLMEIQQMFEGFMGALFANFSALPSLVGSIGDPFGGLDAFMQQKADALQTANDAVSHAQDGEQQAQQRQKAIDEAWKAEFDRLAGTFGELFQGPVAQDLQGFTMSIDDMIADLQGQLDAFTSWRSDLAALASKGLPKELIDQLEALGPSAAENIHTLATASADDLNKWVALWQKSQGAIKGAIDPAKVQADAMASMGDSMDNMSSSMDNMGSSIATLVPTMQDLLAAQKANNDALIQWATDLATLAARHIPRELLSEIMDLGPSAAQAVHLLATSSDTDLAAFTGSWQKAHDVISGISADISAMTDPDAINKALADQSTAFENWQGDLAAVRARLIANGFTSTDADKIVGPLQELGPDAETMIHAIATMTGPQFDTFVAEWTRRQGDISKATQTEFTKQLAMWRTHGQNVAIALVNGVADEQSILEAWFRNLFASLLVGGPVPGAPNLGTPASGANPGLTDRGTNGPNRPTGTAAAVSSTGVARASGISMTVNAMHSESLDTTLARASFRLRNAGLA